MNANHVRLIAVASAILGAAALRLVPHPSNFTPIAAMALFGGAQLGRRWTAFAAPIGALLLSDTIIGFYAGIGWVYASFALIVLIGWAVRARMTPLRIGGAALASSVLFFVATNFGVWLSSGMYPHTAAGFAACYVAAIPFLQNTVAGDLVYSALLFGGFALLEDAVPSLRDGGSPQPA